MVAALDIRPAFARRRGISRDVSEFGRVVPRTTPGGKQRFMLDFGKRYGRLYRGRDSMGQWDWESEADARRYLERIRSRVEDGKDPEQVLDQLRPKARRTIRELGEKWLEEKEREALAGTIAPRSFDSMRSSVKNRWPYWKDTPAEGMSKGKLADWATSMAGEGLAPGTVAYALATLRSFYGWLYDREEIQKIPRFPTVTIPDHTPELLTRAQQDMALAAIPEEKRGIFIALCDCGVRPGEARALQVRDLRSDGWLEIRRAAKRQGRHSPIGPTKTSHHRDVPPLTDRLAGWLREHPPGGVLMFPSPSPLGGLWTHRELEKVWYAALTAAGLPRVKLYEGTKHSTGTHLRERGAALETIQRWFGHTDVAMTQRYAKPRPGELLQLRDRAK